MTTSVGIVLLRVFALGAIGNSSMLNINEQSSTVERMIRKDAVMLCPVRS